MKTKRRIGNDQKRGLSRKSVATFGIALVITLMVVIPVCMTSSTKAELKVDKVVVTVKGGMLGPYIQVYNGNNNSINAECGIIVRGIPAVQVAGSQPCPHGALDKGCLYSGMTWIPAAGFGNVIFSAVTITVRAGNLSATASSSEQITVTKTGFCMFGGLLTKLK